MKHVLGPHISYRAVGEICSIGKRLSKKINSNKLHEIMFSKSFRDREKDAFDTGNFQETSLSQVLKYMGGGIGRKPLRVEKTV